jgi:hypothetical protein
MKLRHDKKLLCLSLFSLALSGAEQKKGQSLTDDELGKPAGYFVTLTNGKVVSRKEHKEMITLLRHAAGLESNARLAHASALARGEENIGTESEEKSLHTLIDLGLLAHENLERKVVKPMPLFFLMRRANLSYDEAVEQIALASIVDATIGTITLPGEREQPVILDNEGISVQSSNPQKTKLDAHKRSKSR